MQVVLEWAFSHPIIVLIAVIVAFVLWLAIPVTWRNGEGSVIEDDAQGRSWYTLLTAPTGDIWRILFGNVGRR